MIQKAQPKEGLETGGLISGSEAARARIAAEYEPDLSGANGPTARFDTLRELINTEIGAAQNEMTFASGDGSQIFGRGGRFAVVAPSGKRTRLKGIKAAASASRPWDLAPAADGQYKLVEAGEVYLSQADMESQITIADLADPFDFGAGKLVYLKLTNLAAPAMALMAGDPPETWPLIYKFVESPDPPAVEEAYFALWQGISGTKPEGVQGKQYGGWWAKPTDRAGSLALAWGGYEFDDNFRHVPVPVLTSL